MSTDYAAVCFTCRQEIHLGVRMAMGPLVFGNGSDDELGRAAAGWWIEQHAGAEGPGHDVRVVSSNAVPEGFESLDSTDLEANFRAERPDWGPGQRSSGIKPPAVVEAIAEIAELWAADDDLVTGAGSFQKWLEAARANRSRRAFSDLPPRLQTTAAQQLPRTRREIYAEALKAAELEYRTAQDALKTDDSNEARARYARALAEYDKLQGQFPFVAAGAGDVEV